MGERGIKGGGYKLRGLRRAREAWNQFSGQLWTQRVSMKISDVSTPYAGYLEDTGEPTVEEVKGRKAS